MVGGDGDEVGVVRAFAFVPDEQVVGEATGVSASIDTNVGVVRDEDIDRRGIIAGFLQKGQPVTGVVAVVESASRPAASDLVNLVGAVGSGVTDDEARLVEDESACVCRTTFLPVGEVGVAVRPRIGV